MQLLDFKNWFFFHDRIFHLLCHFLNFLFFVRFDNNEVSLKCISRILRKFFFIYLCTFNVFLFEDFAILHKFENSAIKTVASPLSNLLEQITHTDDNISLFKGTRHPISLQVKSVLLLQFSISLLIVLIEVTFPK